MVLFNLRNVGIHHMISKVLNSCISGVETNNSGFYYSWTFVATQ